MGEITDTVETVESISTAYTIDAGDHEIKYEVIDNVIHPDEFKKIKEFILNPSFPWNLTPIVTNEKENLSMTASYYFTHEFWSGFHTEQQTQIFASILNRLECKALLRVKGNLYPSTETIVHHDNHIDYEFPHRGAILYINTNNGLTILEDSIEIESIENRLLLFDASRPHRSTTCTDEKCRVNVNFNFF